MSELALMRYRVLTPVAFAAGVILGLTEAQVRGRRHALKAATKGLHEVLTEVQFKAGEELLIAGALPKPLIASLQPLSGRSAAKSTA